MADTLLTVLQRVSRKVGLDPTVTALANDDETNDLKTYINDAYLDLIKTLPEDTPYLLNTNGAITTAASTRTYSLTSGSQTTHLFNWSFENETKDDAPLTPVTLEYLQRKDPKYDETTGVPLHIYEEGSDTIGIYPVPDAVYSIKYKYKTQFSALATTTATFTLPDDWIRMYVDKQAVGLYKASKGFTEAELILNEAAIALADIYTEAYLLSPKVIQGGF